MRLIIKPMGIFVLFAALLGLSGITFWALARKPAPTVAAPAPAKEAAVEMPATTRPAKLPGIKKASQSLVSRSAYTSEPPLNGMSYQQDALITFKGWQYCAFYRGTLEKRHIAVARRKLPQGTWEAVELSDQTHSTNDIHTTISMGLCPGDGTLHLIFDMHMSELRYRRSVPALALNPEKYAWKASHFSEVKNALVKEPIPSASFPRFVSSPSGKLLLEMRVGPSGIGDGYLYAYDKTGAWTELGKYISGPSNHPYINGLDFDSRGHLHITGSWRRTGDPITNHDLFYTYSEDEGKTWKDNSGKTIGTTGSAPLTETTPGLRVVEIPERCEVGSQEGQTVDLQGRVHVLMHDNLSGDLRYIHRVRDLSGKWHRNPLPVPATLMRGKIIVDTNGNAYAILPKATVLAATPENNYQGWWTVFSDEKTLVVGEPLCDRYRLAEDGQFSMFARRGDASQLLILDFQPEPAK